MEPLRLSVLGPPRLERDGQSLAIGLRRGLALLVYLAITERPHSRDTLAALLWPDSDERDARARLRRTIHRLSQDVGEQLLLADTDTLRLTGDTPLWVDAVEFDRRANAACRSGKEDEGVERLARLEQAAALYTDDFLAGFTIPDSPAWDEWQFLQREHLRQTCARALEQLVQAHRARMSSEPAIEHARRWLALDVLDESVHRVLMELYARAGQHALALRQYRECARILNAELGALPEDETVALFEVIRARRLGPEASATVPARRLPPTRREIATPLGADTAGMASLVGRQRELERLHAHFDGALGGNRQVVFVTGEAGLGKTALVDRFVAEVGARATFRLGQGQCIEYRGAGEAYMPILDALGRMCRGPGGDELVAVLAARAPTWLVQMPWVVQPAALEALQTRALGSTRERMLREIVEALEASSAEQPLVLVLEDAHWADYSTIDLLAQLAQRRERARLLVIGTYRPADAKTADHALHALAGELRVRGYCAELPLAFLDETAIGAYLARRFPGAALPDRLSDLVHQRTEGNPLFMINLADSWVAEGHLVEDGGRWTRRAELAALASGVPENVREMIERQLERLRPEDLEILEVASVAGMVSSATAVAAGLGHRVEDVEARLVALARRGQFVEGRGPAEWPDGSVAAQFGFIHHLYQQILYERVPPSRRVRLHREIGSRLEVGYGELAGQTAVELAAHFVLGRDSTRAVHHLRLAAEQSLRRSAHQEAIEHATAGLELLRNRPESTARMQLELAFQAMLGPALIATQGWGSDEAERAFARARELCDQLHDPARGFQIMFCQAAMHEYRGEYRKSQTLIEQRLRSAPDHENEENIPESYDLLACSLFHQGAFRKALDQADEGLARYDPAKHYALIASFGEDPGVQLHGWAAQSLWFLGHPDQSLERAHAGLRLAQDHHYGLACARAQVAFIHQCRGEHQLTMQWAEATVAVARERGFPYWAAFGTTLGGWALAAGGRHDEGIEQIREGLAACRATGAFIDYPYFLGLLADAGLRADRLQDGLDAADEALGMLSEGRTVYYEAELHRLKGDLLLEAGWPGHIEEPEASYRRAVDVAREQGARSLELRALVSLGRLQQRQGRGVETCRSIRELLGGFTEGFDTEDLTRARALAGELASVRAAEGLR